MAAQIKQRKTDTKRPKPNLHGPNSPTPKKTISYVMEENDFAEIELKHGEKKAENQKPKINAKPKS